MWASAKLPPSHGSVHRVRHVYMHGDAFLQVHIEFQLAVRRIEILWWTGMLHSKPTPLRSPYFEIV